MAKIRRGNNRVAVTGRGGVNLLEDPKAIRDDELVRAKNVIPSAGVLAMRKALAHVKDFFTSTSYPIAFTIPSHLPDVEAVFVLRDVAGGGVTTLYLPTPGSNVSAQLCDVPTAGVPQFVQVGAILVCLPGQPGMSAANIGEGGFAVGYRANADANLFGFGIEGMAVQWAETSNGFVPTVGCMYLDRFVFANCGPGYESVLGFADKAVTISADGVTPGTLKFTIGEEFLSGDQRNIQIGEADGDRIVALVPVMLTAIGSPVQSGLFVLKEHSAYLISGQPNETTDPGDVFAGLDIANVYMKCGCASPNTVVKTPYGTLWAGPDDVWLFEGGSVPRRVGSKIAEVLKNPPANLRYRWHAAYHDGFYRLAVFSEGQGPTDDSPCGEQWWLDLRGGAPKEASEASWYGPQVYVLPVGEATYSSQLSVFASAPANAGTYSMCLDQRAGKEQRLYGIERTGMAAVNTASVAQGIVQVEYDADAGAYDYSFFNLANVPFWQADTEYNVGDLVQPTVPNGHYYRMSSGSGDSGATEPAAWGVGESATTDSGILWQNRGVPLSSHSVLDIEIAPDILTKDYNFDDPTIDKIYQGTQFNVWNSAGMRLTVEAILDGGRETSEAISNGAAGIEAQGFIVGVDRFDALKNLSKQFQSHVAWADPATRLLGKHIQLRIYAAKGIVLDPNYLTFAFTYRGVAGTATLSTNVFSTLKTLVEAVVAAMDAWAGSATFTTNIVNPPRDILVTISTPDGTDTWAWDFDNADEDIAWGTRQLGALMGYNTNANAAEAETQTALTPVYFYSMPAIELGGIVILVNPIPREPA